MSDKALNLPLCKVLSFELLLMYFFKKIPQIFKLLCLRTSRAPTFRIPLTVYFRMKSDISVSSVSSKDVIETGQGNLQIQIILNCILTKQKFEQPYRYCFETNTFKNLSRLSKLRQVCESWCVKGLKPYPPFIYFF